MGKAQDLLMRLGGTVLGTVMEDSGKKDDDKDKKLEPINEPEPEKADDFSDINVDDDGDKEKDKPDEFTQSVLAVMKHADDKDEDFDPEQLTAGIKIEGEHIDNKWIQAAIAKAHLSEFPNYYVALAKMEADLKAEMSDKKDDKKDGDKKDDEKSDKKEEPAKQPEKDENDV